MINYKEAKEKALLYLKNMQEVSSDFDITYVLLDEETSTQSFGWVFFYTSKEFLETGDFSYMLVGNAPIIVDKFTGEISETGTAHPIEYYIEQYNQGKRK